MKKLCASEFKAHCYRWIEPVHSTLEHVVITKRGKPVAKLVPVKKGEDFVAGFKESSRLWHAGEGARATQANRSTPTPGV